jgi:hypothetical protein
MPCGSVHCVRRRAARRRGGVAVLEHSIRHPGLLPRHSPLPSIRRGAGSRTGVEILAFFGGPAVRLPPGVYGRRTDPWLCVSRCRNAPRRAFVRRRVPLRLFATKAMCGCGAGSTTRILSSVGGELPAHRAFVKGVEQGPDSRGPAGIRSAARKGILPAPPPVSLAQHWRIVQYGCDAEATPDAERPRRSAWP